MSAATDRTPDPTDIDPHAGCHARLTAERAKAAALVAELTQVRAAAEAVLYHADHADTDESDACPRCAAEHHLGVLLTHTDDRSALAAAIEAVLAWSTGGRKPATDAEALTEMADLGLRLAALARAWRATGPAEGERG